MDSSTAFMLAAFVGSFVLSMFTEDRRISIGIPAAVPLLGVVGAYAMKPGFFETLLFASPFMLAAAVIYGALCYGADKAGRAVKRKFGIGGAGN